MSSTNKDLGGKTTNPKEDAESLQRYTQLQLLHHNWEMDPNIICYYITAFFAILCSFGM